MTDRSTQLNTLLAGRYRVVRELGSGGMGTVYLADDLRHDRQVALKVLRPELTETLGAQRFLKETRITATLQHPHILPLFDSGEVDGLLFYVMPFIEGESLRDRLARERQLPVPEAARILRDVLDGLAAAHQRGIVHRDIKPENILLAGRHAQIADFGIAKATTAASVEPQRDTADVVLGTPAYMAPEQITADPHVDHRADLYAAGAVAYELLTGEPPFAGRSTPKVLLGHLTEIPAPVGERRPTVPATFARLVMKCLEKQPADRWQSAEDMLPLLESLAVERPVMDPDAQPVARRDRASHRAGVQWVTAFSLVSIAALALWLNHRSLFASGGNSTGAPSRARVVVLPLAGATGAVDEASLGQRAAEFILRAIDSTGSVDVVPRMMVQEASRQGDRAAARVAARVSATHAVAGSVSRSGKRVELNMELIDVRSGVPRLVHSFRAARASDSLDLLLADVARHAAATTVLLFRGIALPLNAERIPSSPEVIGHLQRASELGCDLRRAEANEELRKALAIDSAYVPVLGTLVYTTSMMGLWTSVDSLTNRLDALSSVMLPGERLWWDYQRALNSGDWATATAAAERGFQSDPSIWGHGAGLVAFSTRRVREALERLNAAIPHAECFLPHAGVFRLKTEALHLLGRHDAELAEARAFREHFPGKSDAYEAEVRAHAALGRSSVVDSLLQAFEAEPLQPGTQRVGALIRAGLEFEAHGHPQQARELRQRLGALAARYERADTQLVGALAKFYARQWAAAAAAFEARIPVSADSASDLRYRGVALAFMGRRAEALAVSRRVGQIRLRTPGRSMYYQAAIAAALGAAREAVDLLEEAFRSGYTFDVRYHRDPWWEPIAADPAFQALIRPR